MWQCDPRKDLGSIYATTILMPFPFPNSFFSCFPFSSSTFSCFFVKFIGHTTFDICCFSSVSNMFGDFDFHGRIKPQSQILVEENIFKKISNQSKHHLLGMVFSCFFTILFLRFLTKA